MIRSVDETPVRNRRLDLEGAANFRDLGGYPTRDGRETVWGKIFRADSLDALTPADLDRLAGLSLRAVCDLRTLFELRHFPNAFSAEGDHGVSYHHHQMALPRDEDALPGATAAERYARLYRHMLDHSGTTFRAIFGRLADPAAYPYVFHCTAGKDRTGVVAAVVLLAAGVDREIVLADYVETETHAEQLLVRLTPYLRARGIEPARDGFKVRVFPEAMAALLDHLEAEHGGVSAYLTRAGVTDAQLAAFRQQFVREA